MTKASADPDRPERRIVVIGLPALRWWHALPVWMKYIVCFEFCGEIIGLFTILAAKYNFNLQTFSGRQENSTAMV